MSANGSSVWAAASICSGIVLALGGAFGQSYVRDQNRMEHAIREIQSQREGEATERGRVLERIEHLDDLASANETAIREGIIGLDTTLQREMRLLDTAMQVQLDDLDRRLQTEMATVFAEHRERIDTLRAWVDRISPLLWLVSDQERFEDMLGVRLEGRQQ